MNKSKSPENQRVRPQKAPSRRPSNQKVATQSPGMNKTSSRPFSSSQLPKTRLVAPLPQLDLPPLHSLRTRTPFSTTNAATLLSPPPTLFTPVRPFSTKHSSLHPLPNTFVNPLTTLQIFPKMPKMQPLPQLSASRPFSTMFTSPSQPSLLSQIIHPPGMDPKFISMVSTPLPTAAQEQNIKQLDPELKDKLQSLLSPETQAHFDAPLNQKKASPTKDNIIHPVDDEETCTEDLETPMMEGVAVIHPHQVPVSRQPDLSSLGDVEIEHPELPPEEAEEPPPPEPQTQAQLQIIPKVARVRVRVGVREREEVTERQIVVVPS